MRSRRLRVATLGALGTAAFWLAAASLLADGHDSASTASHFQTKGFDLGDPISANAGAFHFRMPLLDLGGPLPLRYVLDYRTDRYDDVNLTGIDGPFGSTLNRWLERVKWGDGPVTVQVSLGGGELPVFTPAAGGAGGWALDAASPVRYALIETGSTHDSGFFYLLDPLRDTVHVFEKKPIPGWCSSAESCASRLVAVLDRNGNAHTWTYVATDSFRPARVSDELGRGLDFAYDARARLVSVTDQAGRHIGFTPEAEAADCPTWNNRLQPVLRSVTDAEDNATTFHYACARGSVQLVGSVEKPAGNVPYTQTYGQLTLNGVAWERRVATQTDAFGKVTTLSYDPTANRVTEARPDGTEVEYRHYHNDGVPKQTTDAAGSTAMFAQTVNEQVGSVSDRSGGVTALTYHPESGKPASITNAMGHITAWTYAPAQQAFTNPGSQESVTFTVFDLVRTDYPDGAHESFTVDGRGNVLSRTDRSGRVWTFTYNARGQRLTAVNPAGGATTYTYNADGTLATTKDADTGTTTYRYDAYGRMERVDHPDGTSIRLSRDLADRVTSLIDEDGRETRLARDANGNLTSVTTPDGGITTYEYDLMDRLTGVTDRLGMEWTLAYDMLSRLESRSDPTGACETYGYDLRGRPDRLTRGASTWTRTRDAEGVPESSTTPLGFATVGSSDALGMTTAVTDPLGAATSFERDAMSRVTSVTDPLGAITRFGYDAEGRLTGVTLPSGDTAAYIHGETGQLERLTDPNGHDWLFGSTEMGRLLSAADPLGRVATYGYDARGRLTSVTHPDGGSQVLTRDGRGNILRREHSGGPDWHYTYDALGRVTAADGIALTRDAEGRVVATECGPAAFGATWDDAGRLAAATYADGAFAVTYTYDVGAGGTGLLTAVADTLTGTRVELGYDADRRLRTLALPNGETVTRTWDNAGRLVRLQSGDHVDVSLVYDAAGRVAEARTIAPLAPEEHLAGGTLSLAYDDASQIASPGYAHDPRGRVTAAAGHVLAWGGASRPTAIDAATLTYDGLGQVSTRTEGGVTTRFHYNHGIGGGRVVAEQDEGTGAFLRFYVWTPEGRLLYLIDAAGESRVLFYHFDPLGSTLALAGQDGEVTDAWAYDPFGRVVARTGASPQPFTFAGAFGVRQEGADGVLFEMGARYYDARTGRFLSREPAWPQLADPKAANPYVYAGGDPVRFIDPTGLGPETPLLDERSIREAAGAVLREIERMGAEGLSLVASKRIDTDELTGLGTWGLEEAILAGAAEAGQGELRNQAIRALEERSERIQAREASLHSQIAAWDRAIAENCRKRRDFVVGNRHTIGKLLQQVRQWRAVLESLEKNYRDSSYHHAKSGDPRLVKQCFDDYKRTGREIEDVSRLESRLVAALRLDSLGY